MAKRPCGRPGCGALVVRGYCAEHQPQRTYDDRRESAAKRGYGRKWQQYSAARLRRHPLCEGLRLRPEGPVVVNTHAGRVVAATATDHIVPHRGDMRLFWDTANHQSGCEDCHSVKTATYDGGFGNKACGISARG